MKILQDIEKSFGRIPFFIQLKNTCFFNKFKFKLVQLECRHLTRIIFYYFSEQATDTKSDTL